MLSNSDAKMSHHFNCFSRWYPVSVLDYLLCILRYGYIHRDVEEVQNVVHFFKITCPEKYLPQQNISVANLFICLGFGSTLCSFGDLLCHVCLGITLGSSWGATCSARDQIRSLVCEASTRTLVPSL